MIVSNLWDRIDLYCDNGHENSTKMELMQMGKTLYYVCPKRFEDNRDKTEKRCGNRISVKEFESMLDRISTALYEAEMSGEVTSLENQRWTHKGVKFRIIEHGERIKVLVYNKNEVNEQC